MEEFTPEMLDSMLGAKSCKTPACPPTKGVFPESTPLAMAYVPVQYWEKPYDLSTALARGTIFPALDKPFIGEEAVRNAK